MVEDFILNSHNMILVPLTETNVAEILSIKIALAISFCFLLSLKQMLLHPVL